MTHKENENLKNLKNKITTIMEESGYVFKTDNICEKPFLIEKVEFSIRSSFFSYDTTSGKIYILIKLNISGEKETLSIVANENNISMLPSEIDRNIVYFWILAHYQFMYNRLEINYEKNLHELPLNILEINLKRNCEKYKIGKDLTEMSYQEAYKHFVYIANKFGYFIYDR